VAAAAHLLSLAYCDEGVFGWTHSIEEQVASRNPATTMVHLDILRISSSSMNLSYEAS
jgi:hypothetical protein